MPDWKPEIRRRLANLKLEPTREAAIVEELSQHLEDCYVELLAGGATEAEARRRTLAELSGSELLAQELRRVERQFKQEPIILGTNRRTNMIADLWQDLRYGARMLMKQPGITLIAVLTLALSIGANTAIFSVINALILNPPHIFEADRVVSIWRTPKDKRSQGYLSYLELQDWQTHTRSFETIAGYRRNGFIMLNNGEAEIVPALSVTANFLPLLKVNLTEGRDFRVEEEKRGAERVVIVSHQFWQSRMGGGGFCDR